MARHDELAGAASACAAAPEKLDTEAKYVRVTELRADGFVNFDFAIGEPEIYVEMLLPQAAFADFCAEHDPIRLEAAPFAADDNDFLWRLADAARAAAGEGAARTHPTG